MLALRALLFAVFGGFIGAAPAAPVVPDRAGHDAGEAGAAQQSQKSEHPGCELDTPAPSHCAAAPPGTGAPGPAPALPLDIRILGRPGHVAAPPGPCRGATPHAHAEDVRAGLLGLPPPPR